MSATATIISANPQVWRNGFLDLRPSVSPCPGLTGANWTGIHAKGIDFLDRWADEAAAMGWTTLDLFGGHPKVRTVRVDFCGALMMSTDFVLRITENRMRFTNTTFHRDTPGRPDGAVALWLFGR
jgi:hypothetical protein